MSTASPVVCLMGPTAAGKTALAIELAERLPVEIVSVDSAMVYRGMDIGTGKPEPALLERVAHHLVDIRNPEQVYSAACFRVDARRAIADIGARGRVALLVGGTGLYFRALRAGLSPLPSRDPDLRAALAREAEACGWQILHRRLEGIDPAAAQRIHPHDAQRIQRALEVHAIAGEPMSALLAKGRDGEGDYPSVDIAIAPASRSTLHRRIAQRFEAMLEAGLVEEVEGLRSRPGVHAELPSMRAVGYRQVWEVLAGRADRSTLVERGIQATRQLARRQLTWLRGEGARLAWFDSDGPGLVEVIVSHIRRGTEHP